MEGAAALTQALLASDWHYFAAGARVIDVGPARLGFLPQLQHLNAGCVAFVDAPETTHDVGWLDELETTVRQIGNATSRLYTVGKSASLEAALRNRGYQARTEIGYLQHDLNHSSDIELSQIETGADWRSKLQLHQFDDKCPDGYHVPAIQWVSVEQRKVAAAYMNSFLAKRNGTICGSVSLAMVGELARLKNIYVHPNHRRQSVAKGIVKAVFSMAADLGAQAVGCFAVADDIGQRLYESCGMERVAELNEWSRELEMIGERRAA